MSQQHDRGLAVIAVFKVSKALLLSVLGVGMLRLLHKDVQEVVESWINLLRFDPDNRFVAALLAKAGLVDDKKLAELSVLTLVYAALFMTEGIGLFLGKRWAEWLSVVATASFLPLEIYEIIQHFSSVRVALFVSNLVIVGYLIFLLRKHPSTA